MQLTPEVHPYGRSLFMCPNPLLPRGRRAQPSTYITFMQIRSACFAKRRRRPVAHQPGSVPAPQPDAECCASDSSFEASRRGVPRGALKPTTPLKPKHALFCKGPMQDNVWSMWPLAFMILLAHFA